MHEQDSPYGMLLILLTNLSQTVGSSPMFYSASTVHELQVDSQSNPQCQNAQRLENAIAKGKVVIVLNK